MANHKFKVGDVVNVYGCLGGSPDLLGRWSWGKKAEVLDVSLEEAIEVKFIKDDVFCEDRYHVHHKQCRKVKKTKKIPPTEAWCVVDKFGRAYGCASKADAEYNKQVWDILYSDKAPHRVALFREVKKRAE